MTALTITLSHAYDDRITFGPAIIGARFDLRVNDRHIPTTCTAAARTDHGWELTLDVPDGTMYALFRLALDDNLSISIDTPPPDT